ncbi:sensor domain-containing phosphodiesterase [Salipaludibacillus sp. CF4.18]|uniref:sensor domain-containing phosphodiesterase n=1 Tax=Salipaludibacillus sp. CF4.18 TaxID=3373081 RepID=UPI003EE46CD4
MRKSTRQKWQKEIIFTGQNRILEMLANNIRISPILEELVIMLEEQISGSIGSILLLNRKQGVLNHGVGPNLPKKYIKFIETIQVGPKEGSCGTAAFRKETVIVSSIKTSPLWENYKIVALESGLKACWSLPIFTPNKKMVGTFAIYFSARRSPDSMDMKRLEPFVRLAGIVIDYKSPEIEEISHVDPVTGLPNSTQLKSNLKDLLYQSMEKQSCLAVVFLDVDRFSVINSIGGYEFGDFVLKDIAKRISHCLGENCTIGRWNSDKFICVIPFQTQRDIHTFIDKALDSLTSPFKAENHEFLVTLSIGISCYPDDGVYVDSLVKNAEIAMKRAKSKGESSIVFYKPSINTDLSKQLIIKNELRQAVKLNEFVLYYQPQVDLINNEIIGLEALIRWEHQTLGTIPPNDFINIAEETGLINPIGEWVLRRACEDVRALSSQGYPSFRLSVNISGIQFRQPDLVESIRDIITDTGINPTNLVLEVTESTLVDNIDFTDHQLDNLKSLGVHIALDDFGTLYSSINYLKYLPMDIMKIDRSFVQYIESEKKDLEILKTIIQLGKNLNLKVLAEGIETNEQLSKLKELGCEEGQGYLFSRPLPIKELKKVLRGYLNNV